MKRALKWLGYLVGGLVLLIVIGVGTVYAITSSRMSKTYPTEVETVAVPSDPVAVARGKHLVEAVGKCTNCHGANLSGTRVFDAAVFMKLTAPNLTAGKGGIPNYTDADWVRAIRYGLNPAGKPLIFMPSNELTRFSDADLGAMIAYLKTVPPADTEVEPARAPGPVARSIYLLADYPLIPVERIDRKSNRAEVTPAVNAEYGHYLAKTGGCLGCHNSNLAGGLTIGPAVSTNLTTAGPLKSWSEADFIKSIRTGTRPDGTKINEVMPWKSMATQTDDELRATWLYIRSVPPVTSKP